jgi:hypothetical protein
MRRFHSVAKLPRAKDVHGNGKDVLTALAKPRASLRRMGLHDKHGAPPPLGGAALALLVAGCNQEAKPEPPQPRPVPTVTVEKGKVRESVVLTGDIRAENEVNLAFRVGLLHHALSREAA